MSQLFEDGGKKYCCLIGTPIVLLFLFGLWTIGTVPDLTAPILIPTVVIGSWFCICCICGNWCGRAGHYRNTPNTPYPLTEFERVTNELTTSAAYEHSQPKASIVTQNPIAND